MSTLPPNIERLIFEHIDSVVRLEVLLLLESVPHQSYSPDELARELRIDPRWATTEASELVTRGLAAQAGLPDAPRFIFAPRTRELAQAVTDLAQVYQQRRVAVVTAIYRAPDEAPPDPVQSFADAFDLRRRAPVAPRGKSPPAPPLPLPPPPPAPPPTPPPSSPADRSGKEPPHG